jgi:hypothetical protein
VAGFLGSPEFFQTKTYNNVRDWLFTAYQETLGRPPDDAGYKTWLQILGSDS